MTFENDGNERLASNAVLSDAFFASKPTSLFPLSRVFEPSVFIFSLLIP